MVVRLDMLNVVSFHGEPIVTGTDNFSGQQGSTGMGFKQVLKRLFHQMVSLGVIYESKKICVMVPLIQDFPTQKKLSCHVLDEFLLAVCGLRRVFTIFDISLDIMVPWLPIDFDFRSEERRVGKEC